MEIDTNTLIWIGGALFGTAIWFWNKFRGVEKGISESKVKQEQIIKMLGNGISEKLKDVDRKQDELMRNHAQGVNKVDEGHDRQNLNLVEIRKNTEETDKSVQVIRDDLKEMKGRK